MKLTQAILLAVYALAPISAWSDPHKDESGHGKRGHGYERREYKEEYWDGNCKVERKFEKNGEYKEERKCRAPRHGHYEQPRVYVPAPGPVHVEPGVTIHGTVRIPQ